MHKRTDLELESPYQCQRCKCRFSNEDHLNLHLQGEYCEFVFVAPTAPEDLDPEDGITPKVEELLTARDSTSKIRNWKALWNALFPDDEDWIIPSPGERAVGRLPSTRDEGDDSNYQTRSTPQTNIPFSRIHTTR